MPSLEERLSKLENDFARARKELSEANNEIAVLQRTCDSLARHIKQTDGITALKINRLRDSIPQPMYRR